MPQPTVVARRPAAAAPRPSASSDGAETTAPKSFRIELATARKHRALAASISAMVNGAYVRELRDALAGDGGADRVISDCHFRKNSD